MLLEYRIQILYPILALESLNSFLVEIVDHFQAPSATTQDICKPETNAALQVIDHLWAISYHVSQYWSHLHVWGDERVSPGQIATFMLCLRLYVDHAITYNSKGLKFCQERELAYPGLADVHLVELDPANELRARVETTSAADEPWEVIVDAENAIVQHALRLFADVLAAE